MSIKFMQDCLECKQEYENLEPNKDLCLNCSNNKSFSQVILITGSRDWIDKEKIFYHLEKYKPCDNTKKVLVIHGECRGADKLSGEIAKKLGFSVNSKPANWEKFGKSAGIIRNIEMVKLAKEYQDQNIPVSVLAFHDELDKSKGTKHCVETCYKNKLKVFLCSH